MHNVYIISGCELYVGLMQWMLCCVVQEDSETRLGVQEALSILSSAFRSMDDTNKPLMEALIIQNFEKVSAVCEQLSFWILSLSSRDMSMLFPEKKEKQVFLLPLHR